MSRKTFQCPKCQAEMRADNYAAKIDYFQCEACKGLLMTESALAALREEWLAEKVVDTGDARVGRAHDNVQGVNCAGCSKVMQRIEDKDQKHIALDSCAACKLVYLDAGELTDLKETTLSDFVFDFIAALKRR